MLAALVLPRSFLPISIRRRGSHTFAVLRGGRLPARLSRVHRLRLLRCNRGRRRRGGSSAGIRLRSSSRGRRRGRSWGTHRRTRRGWARLRGVHWRIVVRERRVRRGVQIVRHDRGLPVRRWWRRMGRRAVGVRGGRRAGVLGALVWCLLCVVRGRHEAGRGVVHGVVPLRRVLRDGVDGGGGRGCGRCGRCGPFGWRTDVRRGISQSFMMWFRQRQNLVGRTPVGREGREEGEAYRCSYPRCRSCSCVCTGRA